MTRTLEPYVSKVRELIRVYSSTYDHCDICETEVKKFDAWVTQKHDTYGTKDAPMLAITPDVNSFGHTTHFHFQFISDPKKVRWGEL